MQGLQVAVAQRIAAHVVWDITNFTHAANLDPSLVKLARVGSCGARPSNAERDFHRNFGNPKNLGFDLRPTMIMVPLQFAEEAAPRDVPFPVFAPHEVFATLHERNSLMKCLVGSEGSADSEGSAQLRYFWMKMASEAWVERHPGLVGADYGFTVPLFIHADETLAMKEAKVYFISVSGLAGGDPVTSRFLLAAIPSDKQTFAGKVNVTLNRVFDFIAWSFSVLQTGLWPATGFRGGALDSDCLKKAGSPLAGGFRGVCGGVKGDQKFHVEAFQWQRHAGCNSICRWCKASKLPGALLWTDVSAHAAWKASWDPLVPRGSLARLPGVHFSNIYDDLFHLLWVQGVGNDLAGSALCQFGMWGLFSAGSQESNRGQPHAVLMPDGGTRVDRLNHELGTAFRLFKAWCRKEKLQTTAPPFTCKTVHCTALNEFPHLNGKGADVRLVCLWLHDFLGSAGSAGSVARTQLQSAMGQDFVACVHNLASFVHGVSASPALLEEHQAAELRRTGEQFIALYLGLAAWSTHESLCLFKIRPKLHLLHHLVTRISTLNPKIVSCMGDESFMGVTGRIARSTHRSTLPLRTLQRYSQVLVDILVRQPKPVRGLRGFKPHEIAERLAR